MGLKWLFTTVVAILRHPEAFWADGAESRRGVNAMKDYAAPVIAFVQLCKIPFIAVPRAAMLLGILSFIVDVSALFLMSGALMGFIGRERQASSQDKVMESICFSLTPVWLAEPFFFFAGPWSWLFATGALAHALLIVRFGMRSAFGGSPVDPDLLFRKAAIPFTMVVMAAFLATAGMNRFFSSF